MSPVHWAAALGLASVCGSAALFRAGVVCHRAAALWAMGALLLLFAAVLFAARAVEMTQGCPMRDPGGIFG